MVLGALMFPSFLGRSILFVVEVEDLDVEPLSPLLQRLTTQKYTTVQLLSIAAPQDRSGGSRETSNYGGPTNTVRLVTRLTGANRSANCFAVT